MIQEPWWKPSLDLFIRLSSLIAAPVILAVFVGRWLDDKYQSEPWLFLACTGLAFVISMFGLIKITLQEFKKITNTKEEKHDYADKEN